jgi:hypothetical protein
MRGGCLLAMVITKRVPVCVADEARVLLVTSCRLSMSGGSKEQLGHINGVPLGDGNGLGGMTQFFMFSYSD